MKTAKSSPRGGSGGIQGNWFLATEHNNRYRTQMAGKKSPCDNCLIEKVFHNNLLLKSEELLFNNRIYDVIMQPFSDVDGSKLVLRNLYDITERKEREQELSLLQAEMAQLERLNLVGQMAAYRTQI